MVEGGVEADGGVEAEGAVGGTRAIFRQMGWFLR